MTKVFKLNLSDGFDPLIQDNFAKAMTFKSFSFKGGERHIQVPSSGMFSDTGVVYVSQRVRNGDDMMDILLAADALQRGGWKHIRLVLPYFPAARQDRVCNNGEPLSVKVYADLINACGFEKVYIYRPHSEVAPALLDNVVVVEKDIFFVKDIVNLTSTGHNYNIVCPDAGAGKHVNKITTALQAQDPWRTYRLIRCEKIRDVKTGKLEGFFVQDDDLGGAPSLILDDVVAMGGTFIGLAEKLREKNSGPLYIFTSHADCQEGLENLAGTFEKVFTTNSEADWKESDKITVLKFTL